MQLFDVLAALSQLTSNPICKVNNELLADLEGMQKMHPHLYFIFSEGNFKIMLGFTSVHFNKGHKNNK